MEYQCGNIFLRPNKMSKGEIKTTHMHEFDHVTVFAQGKFRGKTWKKALNENGSSVIVNEEEVWVQMYDRVFVAGQWCLIEKNVKHEFECLEDGLFLCNYSHRDPQSLEVVQDFNGWMKAYE